jgi:hypothetical protein
MASSSSRRTPMVDGLKRDVQVERDRARTRFTRDQSEDLAEIELMPDEPEAIGWDPLKERRRSTRVSCTTGE